MTKSVAAWWCGAGTSVPRWTTRTSCAPSARQRAAIPSELASDELRGPQRALDDRAAIRPLRRHAEHVAAVDADDHRLAEPSHGVARGGRVVRVDEIERFQRLEHERERRRRPRAPGRVRARPRRRDERRVGHADAVERRAQRLLERRDELAQVARRERRLRRHGPVQHDDLDVRARVPRRERLAVRPHPERRVRDARVVLRDDHDPHACSAAVLRHRLAGLRAGHVGAAVQERLGLRDRRVARVGGRDGLQVADGGRVDHADRPARGRPRWRSSGRRDPSPSAGPGTAGARARRGR